MLLILLFSYFLLNFSSIKQYRCRTADNWVHVAENQQLLILFKFFFSKNSENLTAPLNLLKQFYLRSLKVTLRENLAAGCNVEIGKQMWHVYKYCPELSLCILY